MPVDIPDGEAFEQLLQFLKRSRGFDFTGYKRTTLTRRFASRMQAVGASTYEQYQDYLELHQAEYVNLFNAILINVTTFFRDEQPWAYVKDEVVPTIVEQSGGGPIRIWSAGCASGEEAYSAGMLFADAVGDAEYGSRVKIYATDADEEALSEARLGSYSPRQVRDVPPEVLKKYFEQTDNSYSLRKDIRRSVIFGRHDLMQDAPISRVDLLICRNTLMYFNLDAQSRILAKLYFSLKEDGFLFLGKSEMLLTRTDLFTPVHLPRRVFRKVKGARPPYDPDAALAGQRQVVPERSPLERAALSQLSVPAVVLDASGALVLVNKLASRLLGIKESDVGRRFSDLDASYRPAELRSLIERAMIERATVSLREVSWSEASGEARYFDIEVTPLDHDQSPPAGSVLAFHDVTRYRRLQDELRTSQGQLEAAFEELQSTVEELETTNEELQSTNEELETTNEELQSTNEELETMNEELHSTNDELETLNNELQVRSVERDRLNASLEAILGSVRMGVAVVDREMRVIMWNNGATDLWGLRADEVVDQHLLSLDIGLPVDKLKQALSACLSGRAPRQQVSLPATNRRGRSIECRVTATPLVDSSASIQGAVLLMETE